MKRLEQHGTQEQSDVRNGYPAIFNIGRDPREEVDIAAYDAWVVGLYLKRIGQSGSSLHITYLVHALMDKARRIFSRHFCR